MVRVPSRQEEWLPQARRAIRHHVARLRIAVVACCAAAWMAGALPAARAHGAPPPAATLDQGWEYLPDPTDAGLSAGLPAREVGGWTAVSVPHVFDPRPLDNLYGGTVGWYRLRFQAPPTPPSYGWTLRFEQVRRVATVWLNGVQLGTHTDPYTPFEMAARGIRPGQTNTLVLRVDNRKRTGPREGWWNWGGITRSVKLLPRGAIGVDNLGLMSKLRCRAPNRCTGSLLVDGLIVNRTGSAIAPRIGVWLRSPRGRTTAKTVTAPTVPGGQAKRVRFKVGVTSPELWSPKSPVLYQALVQVGPPGEVTQVERRAIGMRAVAVKSGLLYLNGRPIQLRGASIQEDVQGRGAALTPQDMDRIVTELRALHANVTRAHYLVNEGLLERFDRAGILFWSQAPIYHADRILETEEQRRDALRTLRGTIVGTRSHPSVITHSVANELSAIPDRVPGTRRYLKAAARMVKDLDPTLPPSLDILSYPGFPKQRVYDRFGLLGINNYFGWYPGRPGHSTRRLRDLVPYLRDMREKYPAHAFVMTEFGAEATYNGPASQKETYAFQSSYLRRTLQIVKRHKFISGAIYWTLREFAIKPEWDGGAKRAGVPRDSIHNKGLITYDGRLKPAWQTAVRLFASTPLFREAPPAGPARRRNRAGAR
jgi:hypothetical protein